jgi:hypothetical protein
MQARAARDPQGSLAVAVRLQEEEQGNGPVRRTSAYMQPDGSTHGAHHSRRR